MGFLSKEVLTLWGRNSNVLHENKACRLRPPHFTVLTCYFFKTVVLGQVKSYDNEKNEVKL